MFDCLALKVVKVRSGYEFSSAGEKHIRLTFMSSMEDLELGTRRLTIAFRDLN